jgi:hypothetical protein
VTGKYPHARQETQGPPQKPSSKTFSFRRILPKKSCPQLAGMTLPAQLRICNFYYVKLKSNLNAQPQNRHKLSNSVHQINGKQRSIYEIMDKKPSLTVAPFLLEGLVPPSPAFSWPVGSAVIFPGVPTNKLRRLCAPSLRNCTQPDDCV